jgi:hypothetical protein
MAIRTAGNMLQRYESRNSSVGIETGYGLNDQGAGVRVPLGVKTGSPIQWVPAAFSSWMKRPGREVDHS